MIDHYAPTLGGRQVQTEPVANPYAYQPALSAVGYRPQGYVPPAHSGPVYPAYRSAPAQHSQGSMFPPSGRRGPGLLMIVVATAVTGILGLALTINRAAEARNIGLSTRRYWVAWAVPFTFWASLVVYIKVLS
jgi:hypothetical protein